MNKEELSACLGTTCVENYFLAWIKKYLPPKVFYARSFIPMKKIFSAFLNGARYETFDGLIKVQDLSEKYGITKHKILHADKKEALSIISGGGENLVLVRLNADFYERYKFKPWREDHYVCFDNLKWINHYPLTCGEMDKEEFLKYYGGEILIYEFSGVKKEIDDDIRFCVVNQSFDFRLSLPAEKTDGALQLMKITRARVREYLSSRAENGAAVAILDKIIGAAENLQLSLRKMSLKRKFDELLVSSALTDIYNYEREFSKVMTYA